jgi:hypothetical protein
VQRTGEKRVLMLFWSAHQKFFSELFMAYKLDEVKRLTDAALRANRCVVIGLQSTGETATKNALKSEGDAAGDGHSRKR